MTCRSLFRFLLVGGMALVGAPGAALAATPDAAAAPTAMSATTKAAGDDFCVMCHEKGIGAKFKSDVHYANTLSCADCHGGDPAINDKDRSTTPQTGFRGAVARKDVPLFCSGCHSNAKFMAGYKATLPTNQMALYRHSVHGTQLAAGNAKAPQCVDCHGIHEIRAASDPQSPVNRANITNTCAKCHADSAAVLAQNRTHRARLNCETCHGNHDVQPATTDLLTGPNSACAKCHRPNSSQLRTAAQIADLLNTLEKAGPGSKDALARARQAVHAFSVAAVQHAIDTPATKAAPAGSQSQAASGAPASAPATSGAASTPATGQAGNACLDCHGPYDKIIAATAKYVAPSGETLSPHTYVLHDSKLEKDIPECTHCHAAHALDPLPAKGAVDLSKVNVQWCYDACHHEKTFQSCKDCHA